ncbi:MAG: carbon-nitrogen hydrolase family protein [Shimia thalassica]|uniref:carbon-nitrogen hydrolase family protein n=1 Tax=Shimia thalassica TaxID=1715693 RepID=UPI003298A00B
MSATLEVAIGQCPAHLEGPAARLDWLSQTLDDHAGPPLDLVVLPELFQCGYHIAEAVSQRAEAKDGPFAASIAALAKTHATAIAFGFAERQGETLYNAALCIDKNGDHIGHHRKLLLPPGFEGDHFAAGARCDVFKLNGFSVVFLICYDMEFPENLRHAALQGAEIVVVPTALAKNWGVVTECVAPTRAFENGVFLCYANYCGQENGLDYYGGSCIIAPDGVALARGGAAPDLLQASLEKDAVAKAQARLPYLVDRSELPWVTQP